MSGPSTSEPATGVLVDRMHVLKPLPSSSLRPALLARYTLDSVLVLRAVDHLDSAGRSTPCPRPLALDLILTTLVKFEPLDLSGQA